MVVSSGTQDVLLGIQDSFVSLTFDDGRVVGKAAHAESRSRDTEAPESLDELAVLSVGKVECNGAHALVESRHDGVEGLLVLAEGEAIECRGNHGLVTSGGEDEAIECSCHSGLVLIESNMGVALGGTQDVRQGRGEEQSSTEARRGVDGIEASADARGTEERELLAKAQGGSRER